MDADRSNTSEQAKNRLNVGGGVVGVVILRFTGVGILTLTVLAVQGDENPPLA